MHSSFVGFTCLSIFIVYIEQHLSPAGANMKHSEQSSQLGSAGGAHSHAPLTADVRTGAAEAVRPALITAHSKCGHSSDL